MLGIARSNLKSEHLGILILATVQSEISLNSEQLQNLLEFSGLFYYSIIKFLFFYAVSEPAKIFVSKTAHMNMLLSMLVKTGFLTLQYSRKFIRVSILSLISINSFGTSIAYLSSNPSFMICR